MPCQIANLAVSDVLELPLEISSSTVHAFQASADSIGGVWDYVWSVVHEGTAMLAPVDLASRLVEIANGSAALDRQASESERSMATADDIIRGALVRACVDAYVNAWVVAHGEH